MKRAVSLLLALLLLCLCAAGCTPKGRAHSASRIINKDITDITALAEKILETGEVPEDALYTGVEDVVYTAPDWVGFVTGSLKESDQTAYCGFYFSRDDRPMGYQGQEMELTAKSSGWTYQEPDGSSEYYTERIQFSWYYYEIHF